MSSDNIDYFRERAAVERALAKAATDPRAAAAHEDLARGYDALVKEEELRLALPVEAQDREQRSASA